jgi:hypothetical protein
MDHFPALKEVKIRLQDPKAKEWIKFLGSQVADFSG